MSKIAYIVNNIKGGNGYEQTRLDESNNDNTCTSQYYY